MLGQIMDSLLIVLQSKAAFHVSVNVCGKTYKTKITYICTQSESTARDRDVLEAGGSGGLLRRESGG